MGKVKEEQRKQQIIKSAGHYLCAENDEDLYKEYLKLLDASEKGNDDDLAANHAEVWEPLANHMSVANLIETIENSVDEPEMPELYKDIDWELLKQQKKSLLKVIEDCDNVPVLEHLEGILVLIDSIQDDVVDNFGMSEDLVFDLHSEEDEEE